MGFLVPADAELIEQLSDTFDHPGSKGQILLHFGAEGSQQAGRVEAGADEGFGLRGQRRVPFLKAGVAPQPDQGRRPSLLLHLLVQQCLDPLEDGLRWVEVGQEQTLPQLDLLQISLQQVDQDVEILAHGRIGLPGTTPAQKSEGLLVVVPRPGVVIRRQLGDDFIQSGDAQTAGELRLILSQEIGDDLGVLIASRHPVL